MEVIENWVEIAGHRIRFLQAGKGSPVILLGGLLGGAFCWRLTLPILASRYSVIALELPGTGLSHDVAIDCSMSRQAGRLVEFVKKMGWKEFSVVGSSFG